MSEHTSRRPVPRSSGEATLICGVHGGVLGAVLWAAWRPSTGSCDQIGACLGPVFVGVLLTAAAVPASLVLLWLLGVRRVLATVALGFTAAGALLLAVGDLMEVPARLGSVVPPVWSWALIGAACGALAQWAAQRERSWLVRGGLVVLVTALVWAGTAWADRARDAERLDRFRAVGVEEVAIPQVAGYELTWASAAVAGDEGFAPAIRLRLAPSDGVTRQERSDGTGTYSRELQSLLVPLDGRDPCEVVREIEGSNRQDCVVADGLLEVEIWDGRDEDIMQVGAGDVRGDTLIYLVGDPEALTLPELGAAVRDAETLTLEELSDL